MMGCVHAGGEGHRGGLQPERLHAPGRRGGQLTQSLLALPILGHAEMQDGLA